MTSPRFASVLAAALAALVFPASLMAEPGATGPVPAKLPKPERMKIVEETTTPGVAEGRVTMPWRLYIPEGASADNKLPLIVGLHGAGRRGSDNVENMDCFYAFVDPVIQKAYPAFVLTPQMNKGRSWVKHQGKGYVNYSLADTPATDEMLDMLALVEKTIQENPIDPNRVYLVGQSMGGFGTWDAITRRPELWAAAVPICGGGDPSQAATFKSIPIWAWHGSKDTTVPATNTQAMIQALQDAGGNPKYSEVQAGHGSWNNAYGDPALYEWMYQQRRP